MSDIEKSAKLENPNFKCEKCGSNDVWYTSDTTFDGAYDTFDYHCHNCGHRWHVVLDID